MKKIGILILIVAGFVAYIALSPPGREDVIDQEDRIEPEPSPVASLIEKLRSEWDSEGFADWPVAEVMAQLSQIAYQPPFEAKGEFKKLGFDRVESFVDASMIGYIVSLEDASVVVFRGTDDKSDWIANLDRRAVDTAHGPIHRGFHDAYQGLRKQITDILNQENPKHLWVTGHSLGGALSVVCAYDLIENDALPVNGLVTFGQPMVARSQMGSHLDDILLGKYAHYVHQSDFVPRIPPSFQHCGSLVWFTSNGVKRSKPKRMVFGSVNSMAEGDIAEMEPMSPEEFDRLQTEMKSDSQVETLPDGTPIVKGNSPFIRDHGMEFYLERVQAALMPDEEIN